VSHSGAARKHRAGAISAMLVCLKSAELLYEPSVLTPARSNNRCGFERSASGAGRTLRYAGGRRHTLAVNCLRTHRELESMPSR
jgi:hypothetical protein